MTPAITIVNEREHPRHMFWCSRIISTGITVSDSCLSFHLSTSEITFARFLDK